MKRREFVILVGGAAVWPLCARAQQANLPIIGFINGASPKPYAQNVSAFLDGLKQAGYVDGQNVRVEYHWAEGQYDRLAEMAADIVRHPVSVIVANTPAAPKVKAATATIPIVFLTGDDPVANGLVASLNRPGGNVTGIGITGPVLLGKQLGVMHQFVRAGAPIVFVVNPNNPNSEPSVKGAQEAAVALGRQVSILNAATEAEIDAAFANLSGAGGLVIAPDAFFITRREQLVTLAAREAIPALYPFREFTAIGGLMSYGASLTEQYRMVGVYTGRVLGGAKPSELPVLQPTKYELSINLKTTRKLALQLPPSLLALADEVIE
jgi:putative ABC transport system substrate-binding protein